MKKPEPRCAYTLVPFK